MTTSRIAQEIHLRSRRRENPLVIWSAPQASETLGRSELFGHERGAFTGADRDTVGILQKAHSGTLVIDDADKLALELQGTLLRLLDSWEFRPVGSTRVVKVDIRLLVTANRPFSVVVCEKQFHHDLAWRLRFLRIEVPPLRDRLEDLPPMIEHFANLHAQSFGKPAPRFTRAALDVLMKERWPGNVRQLSGAMANLVFRADEIAPIDSEDVLRELEIDRPSNAPEDAGPHRRRIRGKFSIRKEALIHALDLAHWNSVTAASTLGTSNRTLKRRMQEYGLSRRNRSRIHTNGDPLLVAPTNGKGNAATH